MGTDAKTIELLRRHYAETVAWTVGLSPGPLFGRICGGAA